MVILKSRISIIAFIIVVLTLFLSSPLSASTAKIKDIAKIQSKVRIPLLGYGLVVGLNGTGDSKGTIFTIQSLQNMMQRMGMTLPPDKVKVKNIAAVIITGEMTPLDPVGGRIDVTVSSLGDAGSLEGGMLLLTPLSAPNGDVSAWAQGPVSTGGFNAQSGGGDKVSSNYTLVGRVPGGGLIEKQFAFPVDNDLIKIHLEMPDYTTADRLSKKLEKELPECKVEAISEKSIDVTPLRRGLNAGEITAMISKIENTEVETSSPARIVINEKTGTIVAGANVTVEAVALAHGNLIVEVESTPVISQPMPYSRGETVVTADNAITAKEEVARMVYFDEATNVSELAKALNAIGATSRDIISIFQALKSAGALHAELIII
ncbi:MAG: flagellar basal body P-ring protein FlgI [candidate division Zixibacteria bacterium]|nr:flagellar basal body P-ring protein FlgI [candidate division Zixibacteria bacterium]